MPTPFQAVRLISFISQKYCYFFILAKNVPKIELLSKIIAIFALNMTYELT